MGSASKLWCWTRPMHVLAAGPAQGLLPQWPKPTAYRVCFDLDNTLFGPPEVSGDYSTCRPIPRAVRMCRHLKTMGHHIILHTVFACARTANGRGGRRRRRDDQSGRCGVAYGRLHWPRASSDRRRRNGGDLEELATPLSAAGQAPPAPCCAAVRSRAGRGTRPRRSPSRRRWGGGRWAARAVRVVRATRCAAGASVPRSATGLCQLNRRPGVRRPKVEV